jgi:hypothetical protein
MVQTKSDARESKPDVIFSRALKWLFYVSLLSTAWCRRLIEINKQPGRAKESISL